MVFEVLEVLKVSEVLEVINDADKKFFEVQFPNNICQKHVN